MTFTKKWLGAFTHTRGRIADNFGGVYPRRGRISYFFDRRGFECRTDHAAPEVLSTGVHFDNSALRVYEFEDHVSKYLSSLVTNFRFTFLTGQFRLNILLFDKNRNI